MPKPPSSLMKHYRVRVDGEAEEPVLAFVKKYSSRFILVHHTTTSENPHFHFYCETATSQGNFSNKIKSELGVKGGDYSNKTCDMERAIEYYGYLFNTKKGNVSRLVSYEGFSPIDIATYQANAKQVEKEFQTKMKNLKKTQFEIAEMVLENSHPSRHACPEDLYPIVIATLRQCRTMARPNHVKDIIATVMSFSKNEKANKIVKELTLKFFQAN